MQGTVEKVVFTQGGAGNQWTTINGVKYATYWIFGKTKDWKVGDRVTFTTYHAPLWSGQESIPHAQRIRKAD